MIVSGSTPGTVSKPVLHEKHSTFLEHLLGVHNILKLWKQN